MLRIKNDIFAIFCVKKKNLKKNIPDIFCIKKIFKKFPDIFYIKNFFLYVFQKFEPLKKNLLIIFWDKKWSFSGYAQIYLDIFWTFSMTFSGHSFFIGQ